MSFLERGLVWLSLFISIAPMLGFLGTVWGMVEAFDAIETAGDISPSLVAGGIKIALLTTVGGLVVAIILQFFYNYAVSKIDRIVVEMEEASVELIDSLVLMEGSRPLAEPAAAKAIPRPAPDAGDDVTDVSLETDAFVFQAAGTTASSAGQGGYPTGPLPGFGSSSASDASSVAETASALDPVTETAGAIDLALHDLWYF